MFIASIILSLVISLIAYFKWKFTYWKRRGVPFLPPSIPLGNLQNPLSPVEPIGVAIKHMYKQLKTQNRPFGGVYFFTRPILILVDLQHIQNILTKDFQYFIDRGLYYNEKDDPIGAHFFSLGGIEWRNLRVQLSPIFSTGRIKEMFENIAKCGHNLEEKMETLCGRNQPFDAREIFACFNTDVIGSCAFGLECNALKNEDSSFRRYGKQFSVFKKLRLSQITWAANFPEEARMLKIRAIPKETSDFFTKVFEEVVEKREKNGEHRDDYMQLLLDLKNKKMEKELFEGDGKVLNFQEVISQSFALFMAAVENPSTTLMWTLYELGKNPEIQSRVREEIEEVLGKYRDQLTYDAVQELKYMDQVLNEAMRKYPVLPFVTRQCVKRYNIPGHNIKIEKGMRVVIPIMGIHYDEEYYPNPDEFDPERFNKENSKCRPYYAHIPFGEGPRNCFGMRFGIIAMKVALASILRKYKLTLRQKDGKPFRFATDAVSLFAEEGVWMDAEKL